MFCQHCGHPRTAADRYCGTCGAQLFTAAAAPPAPAPAALPAPRVRLPLGVLLPVQQWWAEGLWRQAPVAFVLLAALTPFALLHLGDDPERFRDAAWGFSGYFALIWFLVLRALVRPEPLPWKLLARTAAFTLLVGVALAVILETVVGAGTSNPVQSTLEVGLPEEVAKALAVYLFLYRRKRRGKGGATPPRSPRTFLFVGAVSGLAFGASEAVSYTAQYAHYMVDSDYSGPLAIETIWRLVTDSLFHACMAGIAAFFIGLAAHTPTARKRLIAFGVGLAAVLHGLYDTYADGWTGVLLAAVIVATFCGYAVGGDRIEARLRSLPTGTEESEGAASSAEEVGVDCRPATSTSSTIGSSSTSRCLLR